LSDESLFREVDEEVRQDEYKKLWSRYGNALVALSVIVVAGVAGFKGWEYWQVKQAESAGLNYFNALKTAAGEKPEEGLQQLAAINHSGFKALAELRSAALMAKQGDVEGALKTYAALSADAAFDPTLRDAADIRAAYLMVDSATPADLQAKLKRFDVDGGPWRNQMREIVGLAAWRVKDYALADKTMNEIAADTTAAPGVRQRAQTMIGLLAPLLAAK